VENSKTDSDHVRGTPIYRAPEIKTGYKSQLPADIEGRWEWYLPIIEWILRTTILNNTIVVQALQHVASIVWWSADICSWRRTSVPIYD
jgi:hypothetical protein